MTPEQELMNLLESRKPTAVAEGSAMEAEMKATDPDFSTPLTLRNIFIHHDAHPIVIHFALLKTFGEDWLNWEPETIWAGIKKSFKTEISEHSRAKIHCLQAVLNTNTPWTQWQVFEKVVQGFNNNIPRWSIMQAPSLEQLYVTIDILDALKKQEFSDEVKRYMAAAVLNEDVLFVPPPLDIIELELAQPYYHCEDCGNEHNALYSDGLCDTCVGRFSAASGFSSKPDEESGNKGRNLSLKLKFNPEPIKLKWDEISTMPTDQVPLEENQIDVQIAKLLIARDYMNIRRKQLADQLIAIKSWLEA